MNLRAAIWILSLACIGLSTSARADDMYRWQDAEGRTHFGGTPPPGARNVKKLGGGGGAAPHSTINVIDGLPDKEPAKPRSRPRPPTGAGQKLDALERDEPTQIAGKSASAWRRQARDLERSVERAEEALEYAEDRLTSSYGLGSSAYWQRRVDQAGQDIEQAQERLDHFQDRARELGVPPGWLR